VKTNPTSIRSSERRFEAGDTLIEVLLALSIIAITAVAILASFSTALGASAEETSIVRDGRDVHEPAHESAQFDLYQSALQYDI
jgi:hypothetical protein